MPSYPSSHLTPTFTHVMLKCITSLPRVPLLLCEVISACFLTSAHSCPHTFNPLLPSPSQICTLSKDVGVIIPLRLYVKVSFSPPQFLMRISLTLGFRFESHSSCHVTCNSIAFCSLLLLLRNLLSL